MVLILILIYLVFWRGEEGGGEANFFTFTHLSFLSQTFSLSSSTLERSDSTTYSAQRATRQATKILKLKNFGKPLQHRDQPGNASPSNRKPTIQREGVFLPTHLFHWLRIMVVSDSPSEGSKLLGSAMRSLRDGCGLPLSCDMFCTRRKSRRFSLPLAFSLPRVCHILGSGDHAHPNPPPTQQMNDQNKKQLLCEILTRSTRGHKTHMYAWSSHRVEHGSTGLGCQSCLLVVS